MQCMKVHKENCGMKVFMKNSVELSWANLIRMSYMSFIKMFFNDIKKYVMIGAFRKT